MYRLLIVDDEPIIVEGLADLFQDLPAAHDLEVCTAQSGAEALEVLRATKIDIVLTDIEMPGISGLDLNAEIVRHWPHCKVVFLTGYNDFDYVQNAIRNGGTDYVLKTEGDEAIVRAVRTAADKIAEELEFKALVDGANRKLQSTLPFRQKEYLTELLQGAAQPAATRAARLQELELPMDPDAPLYAIVGRVDRWPEDVRAEERGLLRYAVRNIAEELFGVRMRMAHVEYGKDRWSWLVQPTTPSTEGGAAHTFIHGCLESVQSHARKLLRVPCSFVMMREPSPWDRIAETFELLKWRLNLGLGQGEEMLITDASPSQEPKTPPRSRRYEGELDALETLLESGQREEFAALFDKLTRGETASQTPSEPCDDRYELYYAIAVRFLSCLNRWGLMAKLSSRTNLNALMKIEEHGTWDDAVRYFVRLADLFFEHREEEQREKTSDAVGKVNEYILRHLGGDVSQTRLAEIVYLSPSYLSRLYKQSTGLSLTEFITNARIQRAKQLLRDTPHKIHDIAAEVGFESASYFTRFFKKMTNMTPQEFRERTNG
ncbi:response regulator [Paenibacillus antri]|uniref:Response regulator n=1 Tax=Paenibacillus antri TaxID=2582848 RepID=A0A5R9GMK1_9BACL|nr:response regulator [Paenibacillus antri]TLS53185.1 response regulator [Paenibacillus antri]